jgi:hypothetical protein
MPLYLENLDDETRRYMLAELDYDAEQNLLHISPFLSGQGQRDYPNLLRAALEQGNDETLSQALSAQRRIQRSYQKRKPGGGFTIASVPANAAQQLAESEFNRYYIRAVARRAIEAGIPELIVYRAKPVAMPRAESEALVETTVDPQALLDDLRAHSGERPALGIPGGPGSGISVRLPETPSRT